MLKYAQIAYQAKYTECLQTPQRLVVYSNIKFGSNEYIKIPNKCTWFDNKTASGF